MSHAELTRDVQYRDSLAYQKLGFPAKLHTILSTPDHQDIIAWLPHGRSWRILQQEQFQEKVLPLFFRHGRHKSFIRQVNGWGFKRITWGPDHSSYYHEHFLRGRLDLCQKMKRLTKEDIAARKQAEPESPPQFYAMPQIDPMSKDEEAEVPPPRAPPSTVHVESAVETLPHNSQLLSLFPFQRELTVLSQMRRNILSQLDILSRGPGSAVRTQALTLPERRQYRGAAVGTTAPPSVSEKSDESDSLDRKPPATQK